jgi:DNA-binding SARP family transcriptional activator
LQTTAIQLCGRLVVEIRGRRVEDELPGRQGRHLLGFLVAHRGRTVSRDALAEVLWPGQAAAAAESRLRPLLSRVRSLVGADSLQGRSELRLVLPADARVDVENAAQGIHAAEAAIAQGRGRDAWLPARIAWSVSSRTFLAGLEADWIEERRRDLEEVRLRALEAIARIGLELGSTELAEGERAARSLVESAPFRESGHRLLMEILAARTNTAEALRVYDALRLRLRDELGVAPSAELQALHERLLSGTPSGVRARP